MPGQRRRRPASRRARGRARLAVPDAGHVADRPLRPRGAPAVRARGRRAGHALVERAAAAGRERGGAAVDVLDHDRRGRGLRPPHGGRRRLGRPARARPGTRSPRTSPTARSPEAARAAREDGEARRSRRGRVGPIDPITFEVIRNALVAATDEMVLALRRSAYSTNIKTRSDFSCAFFDAELRSVAQGFTQPVHLGSMVEQVPHAVRDYGAGEPRAGRRDHHERPVPERRAPERRQPDLARAPRAASCSATSRTSRTTSTSAAARPRRSARSARCSRRA